MGNYAWDVELACPRCGAARRLPEDAAVQLLQQQGMLRRASETPPDLLLELLHSAGPKLACGACSARGLLVREGGEAEGWGAARTCSQCGGPISRERLEALPEATLCAACQARDESGDSTGAPEYCARCGAMLRLQQVAGRVTRYVLKCPECGR